MKKHRGRNEGSITLRADGRWSAIVSLGWAGGRRKRRTVYGKTRAAVATKLTSLLSKRDGGLPLPTRGATLEHFLAKWLESVRDAIRPRTYEKWESVVRLHIVPDLGKARIEKLTQDEVGDLLRRKRAAGASKQSVRHVRMVLVLALKDAINRGLLLQNVAAMIKGPKLDPPAPKAMTRESVNTFLASVEKKRLAGLYVLAFTSGMGRGELLGLKWGDVNLDARRLHVRQSLQRVGGRLQLLPLKTDSARATIDLSIRAVDALKHHRVRQLEERLAAGTDWQGNADDLVFTSTRGTPMEPRNVYRQFQELLTAAGLPRTPFHSARHTTATLLLEGGAHAKQVQTLLRHSKVSTTLQVYASVTQPMKDDTSARIDALFG